MGSPINLRQSKAINLRIPQAINLRGVEEPEQTQGFTLGGDIPVGLVQEEIAPTTVHKPEFVGLQPGSESQKLREFQKRLDRFKSESGGENPNAPKAFTNKPPSFEVRQSNAIRTFADASRFEESKAKGFLEDVLGPKIANIIKHPISSMFKSGEAKPLSEAIPEAIRPFEGITRTLRRLGTGGADFSFDEPGEAKTSKDLLFDIASETAILGGPSVVKAGLRKSGKEVIEEIIEKQADEFIQPPPAKFNTAADLREFAERSSRQVAPTVPDRIANRAPTLDPVDRAPAAFQREADITGRRAMAQGKTPDTSKDFLGDELEINRITDIEERIAQNQPQKGLLTEEETINTIKDPVKREAARTADTAIDPMLPDIPTEAFKDDVMTILEDVVSPGALVTAKNFVADVVKHPIAFARSWRHPDKALIANGAESVVKPIVATRQQSLEFFAKYNVIRKDILAEIPQGSVDAKLVSQILNRDLSGAEVASQVGRIRAGKIVTAAERMRNEFFNPLFDLMSDSEGLKAIVGEIGFTEGYLPIVMAKLRTSKLTAAQKNEMVRRLGPEKLRPGMTLPRSGVAKNLGIEAIENDIHLVAQRYEKSMSKAIHDLPAYDAAVGRIAALKAAGEVDDTVLELAEWWTDNFIGHPRLAPGAARKAFDKMSQVAADVFYNAFIALNPIVGGVNLFQPLVATYPKIGELALINGYRKFLTKKGRDIVAKSGILLDMPGVERTLAKSGSFREKIDRVMFFNMNSTETINRSVSYLGALDDGARRGLSEKAQKDWAMEVVGDTQLFYDKISNSRFKTTVGPAMSQFTTFPTGMGEFIGGTLNSGRKAILKTGARTEAEKRAIYKMTRMVGTWGVIAGGGVLTGVNTEKVLGMWTDLLAATPRLLIQWMSFVARVGNAAFTLDMDTLTEETLDLPWDVIDFIATRYPGSSAVRQVEELVE